MLRITIELVPGGRESSAQVIGRGWIANVSNLRDISNYALKFEEDSWQGRVRGPYTGTLTNWQRYDRGAWEIVGAALSMVLPRTAASRKLKSRKQKSEADVL
jgi:hypothetical protein